METKVNQNVGANAGGSRTGENPRFVAGNPVNVVSKAQEGKQAAQQKVGLNLEETLKLVAELSKRTALRDRYKGYIDALAGFEEGQKADVDELGDETAFQACELEIRDSTGNVFCTKSPSVIKGTVGFIAVRLAERMGEVEAGIVLPV